MRPAQGRFQIPKELSADLAALGAGRQHDVDQAA
jgi:hypothetical protein